MASVSWREAVARRTEERWGVSLSQGRVVWLSGMRWVFKPSVGWVSRWRSRVMLV